jgi:hypothetical protein
LRSAALAIGLVALGGCTAVLGLDKDFQEVPADSGRADASAVADTGTTNVADTSAGDAAAPGDARDDAPSLEDAGPDVDHDHDSGRFDGSGDEGG